MTMLFCIAESEIKVIHYCVVQETFSHCDRITDTTLPIMFPVEKGRYEAASIIMCVDRQDGRHEFEGIMF